MQLNELYIYIKNNNLDVQNIRKYLLSLDEKTLYSIAKELNMRWGFPRKNNEYQFANFIKILTNKIRTEIKEHQNQEKLKLLQISKPILTKTQLSRKLLPYYEEKIIFFEHPFTKKEITFQNTKFKNVWQEKLQKKFETIKFSIKKAKIEVEKSEHGLKYTLTKDYTIEEIKEIGKEIHQYISELFKLYEKTKHIIDILIEKEELKKNPIEKYIDNVLQPIMAEIINKTAEIQKKQTTKIRQKDDKIIELTYNPSGKLNQKIQSYIKELRKTKRLHRRNINSIWRTALYNSMYPNKETMINNFIHMIKSNDSSSFFIKINENGEVFTDFIKILGTIGENKFRSFINKYPINMFKIPELNILLTKNINSILNGIYKQENNERLNIGDHLKINPPEFSFIPKKTINEKTILFSNILIEIVLLYLFDKNNPRVFSLKEESTLKVEVNKYYLNKLYKHYSICLLKNIAISFFSEQLKERNIIAIDNKKLYNIAIYAPMVISLIADLFFYMKDKKIGENFV